MTQFANTATGADPSGSAPVFSLERGGRHNLADAVLSVLARGGAVTVLIMLAALIAVLTNAAIPSIRTFGVSFLTSREWRPNEIEQPKIGPDGKVVIEDGEVVTETIPPAFGGAACDLGNDGQLDHRAACRRAAEPGAALFLVRIAPRWLAIPVSFLAEFLAAIPSIAFGIWGLFVLAPFLQLHVEPQLNRLFARVPGLNALHFTGMPSGRDMLCGGVILGIMVVPIITAVARDVLRAVPRRRSKGPSRWAPPGGRARWKCSSSAEADCLARSCSGLRGRRGRRWR